MDDATAVQHMKQGDPSAMEPLVRKYQVKAVRVAYLITRDLPTAEDVMQTAFVRAYRHIAQFDVRRPFAPWFFRIVANEAVAVLRHRRKLVFSLQNEMANIDNLQDSLPEPQDVVEEAELQTAVWTALEQLSPEQRAVIVLRYYLNYTESEMSTYLDAPLGTIRWRIHAARQRLRALLYGWKTKMEG